MHCKYHTSEAETRQVREPRFRASDWCIGAGDWVSCATEDRENRKKEAELVPTAVLWLDGGPDGIVGLKRKFGYAGGYETDAEAEGPCLDPIPLRALGVERGSP